MRSGFRVLDLDQRDIRARIFANHLRVELTTIAQLDFNHRRVINNVVVGDDIAFIGINDNAGTQRHEFLLLAAAITAQAPWQNGELWNGEPSWQNGESSPKNCWKLRGIRGVLTVVLPSTLMLTTEGITFSSIGARLGICWAVVAEEVSAAVAESGDNAKPKLRASALSANVVFSCISVSINR